MLDKDGYIKFINPAVSRMTGYESQDLLNRHLSVLYPNTDTTKSEYELSVALKKGITIAEGWKIGKNNSKFWAELTLSANFEEKNVLRGYNCILRDISERKQLDLDLRKSEERYRLMVEGVQDYGIFMLDPKGNILTWNEGAKRTKGYNQNEIIGKHFSIFYTLQDIEDGKPPRELLIASTTGKYEEEAWRVKKNGSVFWANVVITALYNETNILVGFSKVTRDLTVRKENEELLRQSEERYRLLVEQVTDYGIFMLDEKGRIISWNEGAKKIKGYAAEEIIGKYFSIFYPEEDILNGKPAYELKVAMEVGKYEEEGWRIKKDGTLFWANVVITAVYNHDNILIGFSKVTRDLTERKASERELRDSYDRYRNLAEELKITNKFLSNANEELEQFTSIVSHDLQEPVRTIRSFLQLIEIKMHEGQEVDLKTYIAKAIKASNRMKELIQNVLDYSQLAKVEIKREPVNVEELLSETLQNIKTSADAAGASIAVESEVETVYGDRVQLVQLLQNLVSNAVKFTNGNKPEVTIKSTLENGQVKFAVSDNGIGISESNVTKIFEIFRRLNSPKAYPGTGIGLAICKKIVDRHKGKIWTVSELGKGTTFYFTINQ
ncbi:MAG: histidine kinase [Segetibacter sp.]|nr:histidine kinase [Segetibacter sp.]